MRSGCCHACAAQLQVPAVICALFTVRKERKAEISTLWIQPTSV